VNAPANGSQASLRAANRRRVLSAVQQAGGLSQVEIARVTGLSPASVSNIVRELSEARLLTLGWGSSGGRRARSVRLSRSAGVAVGVDFGHSHLRVAVGNLCREVLAEREMPLDVDASAADGFTAAGRLLRLALRDAAVRRRDVVAVGMGVPGPIDATTGALASSSILPGWAGVRAAEAFGEQVGLPVLVDNDANLGALGEFTRGAARGRQNIAYIKIATGVGAGLVIGGHIYHGVGGTAGEIGHMTIDERGRVCRCGNRGCLETYASAPFLLELLRHCHGPALTVQRLLDLAAAGDPGCRRVLTDAGRQVGIAVANLCNLLNPDTVVVGGPLAAAGDLLLDPIRETVRRHAIASAADQLTILPSWLGPRAEVLGALAMAVAAAEPLNRLTRNVI
jgi:predicted NBD/HSP70 family sugar kinase